MQIGVLPGRRAVVAGKDFVPLLSVGSFQPRQPDDVGQALHLSSHSRATFRERSMGPQKVTAELVPQRRSSEPAVADAPSDGTSREESSRLKMTWSSLMAPMM